MLTQVLLLIVGLVMVVAGADFLVDGASSIARKAGISEFVIGLTIVAIRAYIADNGYAKLKIALAKGKKEYDKRQSIKEKDMRRELDRG